MKNKLVKCDECTHVIEEVDAQKVIVKDFFSGKKIREHWYCVLHKKPYDEVWKPDSYQGYVFTRYIKHNIEVNSGGKTEREEELERELKKLKKPKGDMSDWAETDSQNRHFTALAIILALGLIVGLIISLVVWC